MSKHPIIKNISHMYEFTEMGRDIKVITIRKDKKNFLIATSHFESEFRESVMKKTYQYQRCSDILSELHKRTNSPVILCSDTNVCEQSEYQFSNAFSYAGNWRDAWIETGSDENREITFDTMTNPILLSKYIASCRNGSVYSSRLDRIVHLSDLHVTNFEIVGTGSDIALSDHYGIVCSFGEEMPNDRGKYLPVDISPYTETRIKVTGKRYNAIKKNYRAKRLF